MTNLDLDTSYPLGRRLWHDPQNREHRAYTATPQRPDKWSLWYHDVLFNQQDQNCTTEAFIGLCMTTPMRFAFKKPWWEKFDTEEERIAYYKFCQKYDPAAWGTPHDGSASDSPYKGARELGYIKGWKWLFGYEEAKQWIMYDGPFTAGTIWLESMFTPVWEKHSNLLPGCYINVDTSSPVAGGHEWLVIGYSPGRDAFRMVQSWGNWGDKGRAWIRGDKFRWLLENDGDCVTVLP